MTANPLLPRLEINLNSPAPSSVWETDYSLKPTLPCKGLQVFISSRRKHSAEEAVNGRAVMDMGAHMWMCFCAKELVLQQWVLLLSVGCRILENNSKMSRQRNKLYWVCRAC